MCSPCTRNLNCHSTPCATSTQHNYAFPCNRCYFFNGFYNTFAIIIMTHHTTFFKGDIISCTNHTHVIIDAVKICYSIYFIRHGNTKTCETHSLCTSYCDRNFKRRLYIHFPELPMKPIVFIYGIK